MRAILFDDQHIRAIWQPGGADYLLVTFGDMVHLADGDRFFAEDPVARNGLSCLGIMAKEPNWFPAGSVRAAVRAAENCISGWPVRVVYGGSMGGYAAIKFSRLLAATEVIALCPQWSIDPAECGDNDSGYAPYYVERMRGMGIRRNDISGRIFIFCDPQNTVDTFHQRQICQLGGEIAAIPVYAADHHVTAVLAGAGNFYQMIETCRFAAAAGVLALVNQIRRRSSIRGRTLIGRALRARPAAAARLLLGRAADPVYRAAGPAFAQALIPALVRSGHHDLAGACCDLFQPTEFFQQVCMNAMIGAAGGENVVIFTGHGSIIVYDIGGGSCRHIELAAYRLNPASYGLIHLQLADGGLRLLVKLANVLAGLCLGQAGELVLIDGGGGAAADFAVEDVTVETFRLRAGGRYLSAGPDGSLYCNRDEAFGWEAFRIGRG